MRRRLLLERRRPGGVRLRLRDGAGELLPAAAEEALDVVVDVHLRLRERRVDLRLVRGEERAELRLVEPGGAGCLREREVEEEEGLERVVEW